MGRLSLPSSAPDLGLREGKCPLSHPVSSPPAPVLPSPSPAGHPWVRPPRRLGQLDPKAPESHRPCLLVTCPRLKSPCTWEGLGRRPTECLTHCAISEHISARRTEAPWEATDLLPEEPGRVWPRRTCSLFAPWLQRFGPFAEWCWVARPGTLWVLCCGSPRWKTGHCGAGQNRVREECVYGSECQRQGCGQWCQGLAS